MSRNRSISFYYKKSEKTQDNACTHILPADCLRTKTTPHVRNVTNVNVPTIVKNNPFSGSTPVLSQLLGDLEENPIFKQQKQRNRRSKSIDFLTSKPVIHASEGPDLNNLEETCQYNHQRKSFSATNLEVLKTFQFSREDSGAQHYPPHKFPLSDDAESVELRKQPIDTYRISKTTDFDYGRKNYGFSNTCQDFEVRGCGKIHLPNDNIRKLKKNEIIKYQNGNIYKCTENNRLAMDLLQPNVKIKNARLLNKKEVELSDEKNSTFLLIFDSAKEAKSVCEKLSPYVTDDQKSVKKTLFKLLGKRSSREVLEKKGIYQNEPIFGNTLKNIYNKEKGVPQFILKTVELIEKPDNIKSLGIYRTSGNLATIQKIRFEVDKGRIEILNEYSKDVDVLTGTLKLFFRELKEPLISCDACDQLLILTKSDMSYTKKEKEKIKIVLNHLPEANWETLRVLLRHLVEVTRYKDQNKMDTYNLSVCWGPTVIFATETINTCNYKDIVTQSTEATRMFESLLLFFINNPEELESGIKKQDSLDRNRNLILRQESRESIQSSDSNNSKGTVKRSGSNSNNVDIDDITEKMIEIIESNLNIEGLYKKSGSADKVSKLNKKVTKKKIGDLEKYKTDILEMCTCLKLYLQGQEPLVTRQVAEQILMYCDNTHCLEQNTRQRVILALQDLPRRETFTFLLKHIMTVLEHEPYHKISKYEMISIWANVLNHKHIVESDEKFSIFLRIVLEAFDKRKADIINLPRGMTNGLLNDLKNLQKERDRTSKYDNVPDDADYRHEAILLDEKTDHLEHTKL